MAMAFPNYNIQRPQSGQASYPPAHPPGQGTHQPQRQNGAGGLFGNAARSILNRARPEPNCRITSTEDGILRDKLNISCDCTCNYQQTDTVLLGRSTNVSNCYARQMQQINALRNLAGRR